jgi:hypothetical protein
VEAREGGRKDFLGLLRQIRDGDASKAIVSGRLLHGELPTEAFRRFNWELNSLLGPHGVRPEWKDRDDPSGQPIPDAGFQLSDGRRETIIKDIFDAYLGALREVTESEALVLALDQFRGAEDERLISATDLGLLAKYLFRPIADAESKALKLVLVLDDSAAAEVGKLLPKDRFTSVTVDHDFDIDALVKLVVEMFRYPGGENEKNLEKLADIVLKFGKLPHKGLARLQQFREIALQGGIPLSVDRMK